MHKTDQEVPNEKLNSLYLKSVSIIYQNKNNTFFWKYFILEILPANWEKMSLSSINSTRLGIGPNIGPLKRDW